MNLSSLNSSDLRSITKMLKKKETLQKQITAIDKKLTSYGGGSTGTTSGKRRGRPPGKKAARKAARRTVKRTPRGATKEKIIGALKRAGTEGITIMDLVKKTALKDPNVRVWFHTTG